MTPADIIDLYRYNAWANDRIVASILPLSPDDFTRQLGGSHPSIREAFAHLVSVEWVWLERWTGTSPTTAPEWLTSSDQSLLARTLSDVETRRETLLAGLSEAALQSACTFAYLSGTAGSQRLQDLLVHVVNHSSYHRGQLAAMLRQVGRPAQCTDFDAYAQARRH